MKKVILRVCIVLAVLIIIAIVAVGLSLDGIVKSQVERIGSNLTKVNVQLDGVSLSPMSGSGEIRGLSVGNPPQYKTPQAITVSNATLSLKPGSLLSSKIVITKIEVIAPEVTFEGGLSGNNLSQILANVKAADTNAPATREDKKNQGTGGKKLEVDDFRITGAKLHLNITGFGASSLTVPLPEIHLTDLGKEEGGITKAELTKRVIGAIEAAAAKAAAEHAGDLTKTATGMIKGINPGTSNTVNEIGKGIQNLFKKK